MDPKQIGKQIIDFNKKAFENSFSAMCTLQEQAEKTFDVFMEKSPMYSDETRKIVAEWRKNYIKGRDQFKAIANENFDKAGSFFNAAGMKS